MQYSLPIALAALSRMANAAPCAAHSSMASAGTISPYMPVNATSAAPYMPTATTHVAAATSSAAASSSSNATSTSSDGPVGYASLNGG